MRKTLLTAAAFASLAFGQSQTFTYSYSGLPIPIYPDDWNTISVISMLVPRSIAISKVTASVQIQYSGIGDINMYLYSPIGTRTKLLERNCGSLVNLDTTFDDAASTKFSDSCPSTTGSGTYRGNEPLSNSNNENAFGYWRIAVENNGSNSKSGLLTRFSITITGTLLGPPVIGPNTIVSVTSFDNGPLAPADQLAIFGANLGPTTGVRSDGTKQLPTNLSGTTVTFDGTAVPIYYVSDQLVVVQAPPSLNSGTLTKIQVVSTAGTSSTVSMPVVPARPGIFTYDAGGKGQAKAVNQDGSLNGDGSITGSDKAASPGSVVSLYASGLGTVSPAIAAGTPAPASPLSTVTLPVSANVGGRSATVTYAGAAPGLVGTYQVNVLVPLGTPSGDVRVVLSVDGNDSQTGATLRIR